jgi:hypothetical protein
MQVLRVMPSIARAHEVGATERLPVSDTSSAGLGQTGGCACTTAATGLRTALSTRRLQMNPPDDGSSRSSSSCTLG